ncbi:MAG: hypothetical protein HKN23_09225 [Verrucomicrobiales bacterium]|nr:hypothetical protein [Verrucomicrobiales bacterium]
MTRTAWIGITFVVFAVSIGISFLDPHWAFLIYEQTFEIQTPDARELLRFQIHSGLALGLSVASVPLSTSLVTHDRSRRASLRWFIIHLLVTLSVLGAFGLIVFYNQFFLAGIFMTGKPPVSVDEIPVYPWFYLVGVSLLGYGYIVCRFQNQRLRNQ